MIAYLSRYLQLHLNWLFIIIAPPIFLTILYVFMSKQVQENSIKFKTNLSRRLQTDSIKDYAFLAQVSVFLVFLGVYIFSLVYGEDFAYHDNDHYTLFQLEGRFFPMPVWPKVGRLWPLGHQEFNIIGLFTKSPLIYHLFPAIQLVWVLLMVWFILDNKNKTYKLLTLLFLLTINSFTISFQGLIFPERNLIFWLSILILSLQNFDKKNSIFYFFCVIASAQMIIYYKESSFLLISGIAASRLMLDFLSARVWNQWRQIVQFMNRRFIEVSLITLSAIFVLVYAIDIIPATLTSYAAKTDSQWTTLSVLKAYIGTDFLLAIFLISIFLRILYLLIARKSPDSFWDSIAVGALLYFLVYLKLEMYRSYYTAPVDFIAVLYLSNLIYRIKLCRKENQIKAFFIITLVCILFVQNISLSSYSILARKKIIESRFSTAQFILDNVHLSDREAKEIDLFFPVNGNYYVMQFIAYLNYKNNQQAETIGIENIQSRLNSSKPTVKIYVANRSRNDLCKPYRVVKCYHKSSTLEPELVAYIPEDGILGLFNPDINSIRQRQKIKSQEFIKNADPKKIIFRYKPKFRGLEKVLLFFIPKNYIDSTWLNSYILSD